MIQIEGLRKSFGNKVVVDIPLLRIDEGSTMVLIGPSGCGKSTLLRLMMHLSLPDAGTVRINGLAMSHTTARLQRQKLGYVIQEGGLFPHMTAAENVTLMARRIGWDADKIARRLKFLTELVHLEEELLSRFPIELSGGQRQRFSLMRALILDPPVLFLDEPLGALDPIVRYKLQTDLKTIFDQLKKTVVFVTHDMAEAAYFGTSIALMKDGKIVQIGSANELVKNPAHPFVSEFISAQRQPAVLIQ